MAGSHVDQMTKPLKVAIAGLAVLLVSWGVMTLTSSPWDLFFLVVGVACVPLWLGLVALGDGAWKWYRGPNRWQAAAATVLGLAVVLLSGRVLLAVFGWH